MATSLVIGSPDIYDCRAQDSPALAQESPLMAHQLCSHDDETDDGFVDLDELEVRLRQMALSCLFEFWIWWRHSIPLYRYRSRALMTCLTPSLVCSPANWCPTTVAAIAAETSAAACSSRQVYPINWRLSASLLTYVAGQCPFPTLPSDFPCFSLPLLHLPPPSSHPSLSLSPSFYLSTLSFSLHPLTLRLLDCQSPVCQETGSTEGQSHSCCCSQEEEVRSQRRRHAGASVSWQRQPGGGDHLRKIAEV